MSEPPSKAASLSLGARREAALEHAAAHVLRAWTEFDQARDAESPISPALRARLALPLPEEGKDPLEAIDWAAEVLDTSMAQSRPRFFGFIGSSGLEMGALADLLAHSYDINLAVDAGAATALETQAVDWLAQFLGYPAATGTFTSGGTVSNITALTAAREAALPGSRQRGLAGATPTVYCSSEAHYSITRAAETLGIGRDFVRAIAIDDERALRVDQLRRALDEDRVAGCTPIAIVATAGTTLTGAVDPIDQMADVAAHYGVWLHVDGAYGLPAATVAACRPRFAGLERADSVTVDCHKWMFVPKACSALLVRDGQRLAAAFAHDEAYVPHAEERLNAVDLTLEYSRPFRALKLWLALLTHGAAAVRAAVARNCAQAQLLYDQASEHPLLATLERRPTLSIAPVRVLVPGCSDPDAHTAALCTRLQEDGRVFVSPATIDGSVWLRPCFTNFRTTDEDVAALVDVVLELGRHCADLHG